MKYIAMRRIEYIKAATFTSLLFISALIIICYAFTQNRSLIIGSELNSNGTIEYMCLGRECENLNRFSWND